MSFNVSSLHRYISIAVYLEAPNIPQDRPSGNEIRRPLGRGVEAMVRFPIQGKLPLERRTPLSPTARD